jgi:hypothetical protein
MVCFFTFPSGCFHLTFIFRCRSTAVCQCENNRQENHERHHWVDDALSNSHLRPASMPPPMPAYIDPTTISSTKPSINTNQYFESPFTTPIPPSISPLTSFANLSSLSPALLRSTPPPSLLVPFARPLANPGMSTPTVPLPRDKNTAAWSPLQRHTAVSPPSLLAPVSLSLRHNDVASIASSSSSSPL